MKQIEPKLLRTKFIEEMPTQWATKLGAGNPIKGRRFIYEVADANFASKNIWHAWVQVPNKRSVEQGIEIRLDKDHCPDRAAVNANLLWRKSVVFEPTTIGNHLNYYYAKVFETEGARGKTVVKRGQRDLMFPWLQASYFLSQMRLKGTVATSGAHDLQQQVLLARPDDHQRMIRIFFGLRIWASL